jgi:hypothetical protein
VCIWLVDCCRIQCSYLLVAFCLCARGGKVLVVGKLTSEVLIVMLLLGLTGSVDVSLGKQFLGFLKHFDTSKRRECSEINCVSAFLYLCTTIGRCMEGVQLNLLFHQKNQQSFN